MFQLTNVNNNWLKKLNYSWLFISKYMSLEDQFNNAVQRVERLTKRPTNEELLQLYALFKQATEGDVTTERPGGFDFKAIAKYNAWMALKGKPREEAMQEYIALVDNLTAIYQ